jgi:hypothetical protein
MQTQRNKKLTSHQKIVAIMANNREKTWYFAKDIINLGEGDYYVGYEATARLSELVRKFPDMFESMGEGKYIKRRIRWEAMSEWFEDLPTEYRHIIHKTGRTHGVIRKDPHSSTDEPEPAIDFNDYVAEYVGRKDRLPNGVYDIKMSKLVMGRSIVIKVPSALRQQTFIYNRIDDLKKDWRVK